MHAHSSAPLRAPLRLCVERAGASLGTASGDASYASALAVSTRFRPPCFAS